MRKDEKEQFMELFATNLARHQFIHGTDWAEDKVVADVISLVSMTLSRDSQETTWLTARGLTMAEEELRRLWEREDAKA